MSESKHKQNRRLPAPGAVQAMDTSPKTDQTALLGVVLAGALAVFVVPGPWEWSSSTLGVTLLLILHAYDKEREKSLFHLLAFGAVWGMCLVLTTGMLIEKLLALIGAPMPSPRVVTAMIEGKKYFAISTEETSRLGEGLTAILWIAYGAVGTLYAGRKRGRW